MFVLPVFVGFLILGFVVVRRTIGHVEGRGGAATVGPGFKDGWRMATGLERAAFMAMAVAIVFWTALILFVPWALAMGVVAWLVWHRPYLRVPLGRVLVLYGVVAPVASVLSWRGDGGAGAIIINALIFGLPALLPGTMLLLSARSR